MYLDFKAVLDMFAVDLTVYPNQMKQCGSMAKQSVLNQSR